ncbi:MAG: aminotransferase class III-fold pyridoxal phosphate-dependent enzyme, partial [Myxococcota bacterium]
MERDAILALDRRYVWRPYTSSIDHETGDDLVVAGAEGCFLIDEDGRRLLDGTSSWWTSNLGYGHPRLSAALKGQVDTLAHVAMAGATHRRAAELAEALVARAPKGDRKLA